MFKIGVMADSFRRGVKGGLDAAGELGVRVSRFMPLMEKWLLKT